MMKLLPQVWKETAAATCGLTGVGIVTKLERKYQEEAKKKSTACDCFFVSAAAGRRLSLSPPSSSQFRTYYVIHVVAYGVHDGLGDRKTRSCGLQ